MIHSPEIEMRLGDVGMCLGRSKMWFGCSRGNTFAATATIIRNYEKSKGMAASRALPSTLTRPGCGRTSSRPSSRCILCPYQEGDQGATRSACAVSIRVGALTSLRKVFCPRWRAARPPFDFLGDPRGGSPRHGFRGGVGGRRLLLTASCDDARAWT